MRAAFSLMALLSLALPAAADEMWDTQFGRMLWETDIGDTAVFVRDAPDQPRLRAFIQGLALDVAGGRGAYSGFWTIEGGEQDCPMQMTDPMGTKTSAWGQLQITFVGTGFPSDWAGLSGSCFETPDQPISGVAVTGQ